MSSPRLSTPLSSLQTAFLIVCDFQPNYQLLAAAASARERPKRQRPLMLAYRYCSKSGYAPKASTYVAKNGRRALIRFPRSFVIQADTS